MISEMIWEESLTMLDGQQEEKLSFTFLEFPNSDFMIISQFIVIFQKLEMLGPGGWKGEERSFDIYLGVCFLSKSEYPSSSCYFRRGLSHYSTLDLYFKLDESEVESVSTQQVLTSNNVVFEMAYNFFFSDGLHLDFAHVLSSRNTLTIWSLYCQINCPSFMGKN